MSQPYLVVSDCHFHNFTAFAELNSGGVNSRLQIQIDEFKRAVDVLIENGGDTIFNAGDTFHVRGRIETTVLNPVKELFEWVQERGVVINSIPGNHDLAGKESDTIGNAAQSLVGKYSFMVNECTDIADSNVVMFAWNSSIDKLKERLEAEVDPDYTAIIHAPVNDVIYGIPNHGLDAEYLAGLGYKRVLSGHYHNHKRFDGEVYSIGAMCHQTWGDVHSRAGFLLVTDDEVKYMASHAPKFVDVTEDNFDDAELLVDGNYARIKINVSKESEVSDVRKQLIDWGAKGVVINQIRDLEPTERTGATVKTGASIKESVEAYIDTRGYDDKEKLSKLCCDILDESEGDEI